MTIDPRFYDPLEGMTFVDLASKLGHDPRDTPNRAITGIASFDAAGPNDLCFLENAKALSGDIGAWSQGCCLISASFKDHVRDLPQFLSVESPRQSFFKFATRLFEPISEGADLGVAAVHPTAHIGQGCQLGPGVAIGPHTCVGANSVIGPGVQIGANCDIGANASIHFSLLGNGVRLLAGARLGEAGFGLMAGQQGLEDIPHFGRVIVQDNVTIGANSCVDRGMLGDTVIGEGSKIDNLSHIGHNTQIGRQVVMAAYAGISGSVTIGDGVRLGGRVGLVDHLTIGPGAQIAAGSAVLNDVPSGEVWAGAPAKPIRTWQREILWLKRNAKRGRRK